MYICTIYFPSVWKKNKNIFKNILYFLKNSLTSILLKREIHILHTHIHTHTHTHTHTHIYIYINIYIYIYILINTLCYCSVS